MITTYFMLARENADQSGSVASMPILAATEEKAMSLAQEWLDYYEHGFAQAVIALSAPVGVFGIHFLIDTYVGTRFECEILTEIPNFAPEADWHEIAEMYQDAEISPYLMLDMLHGEGFADDMYRRVRAKFGEHSFGA
jgi:hypothetical protein